MSDLDKHAGTPNAALSNGQGLRFGIVMSRYNEGISRCLLEGASECLKHHGVAPDDISVIEVPGAWEIPMGLTWLSKSSTFDGLLVVGVVIRGETPHFDYVCRSCADGCDRVAAQSNLVVGFGLLTCDTVEQANERAGGAVGNKGVEAAMAALEMANLKRSLITPVIGHL